MQDLAREFDEEKGTRWEILKKRKEELVSRVQINIIILNCQKCSKMELKNLP